MDIEVIKKAFDEARGKQLKLAKELTELAEAEKELTRKSQLLIQEAYRVDGEVRALQNLLPSAESKGGEKV